MDMAKAESEAEAQVLIIRALRKLPDDLSRLRVWRATRLVMEADALVPGIAQAVAERSGAPK